MTQGSNDAREQRYVEAVRSGTRCCKAGRCGECDEAAKNVMAVANAEHVHALLTIRERLEDGSRVTPSEVFGLDRAAEFLADLIAVEDARTVGPNRVAASAAPPEPFSVPVVRCQSCGHGIDAHGSDPGGPCGVGDEDRNPCACMWQPNDIAARLPAAVLSECELDHGGEHNAATVYGHHRPARTCLKLKESNAWVYDAG